MKKVAVILCGSGFKDGSEIREAVGVLWALSAEGAAVECFALDEPQSDVVDCFSGQTVPGEKRNQLAESARIARGKVRPLDHLKSADFDALVMPGGFGAAKNLCTFAREGSIGRAHPKVQAVLEDFHRARKSIGAVCIAPVVVALAFRGKGFELTVGAASEASAEIEKLGHKHVVRAASEWHADAGNRIFSTPAYMYDDASLKDIFSGIQNMVHGLLQTRA